MCRTRRISFRWWFPYASCRWMMGYFEACEILKLINSSNKTWIVAWNMIMSRNATVTITTNTNAFCSQTWFCNILRDICLQLTNTAPFPLCIVLNWNMRAKTNLHDQWSSGDWNFNWNISQKFKSSIQIDKLIPCLFKVFLPSVSSNNIFYAACAFNIAHSRMAR